MGGVGLKGCYGLVANTGQSLLFFCKVLQPHFQICHLFINILAPSLDDFDTLLCTVHLVRDGTIGDVALPKDPPILL
jgi:hypothetical protein